MDPPQESKFYNPIEHIYAIRKYRNDTLPNKKIKEKAFHFNNSPAVRNFMHERNQYLRAAIKQ